MLNVRMDGGSRKTRGGQDDRGGMKLAIHCMYGCMEMAVKKKFGRSVVTNAIIERALAG